MTATPQDVQARIDAAVAELKLTTKSGAQMVRSYGPDVSRWPAGHWVNGLAGLDAARAEAGLLVAPSTPPPPPPPPSDGPTLDGRLYSPDSPWNTPIPASPPIHPDSVHMITGVWTDSGGHPHAWSAVPGYAYSAWLGPRQNVGRTLIHLGTVPLVTLSLDFPSRGVQLFQAPIPSHLVWHQDFASSDNEHRTMLQLDDGSSWLLYQLTPPGVTPIVGGAADGNWHARGVEHRVPGWTGRGDGYKADGNPYGTGSASKMAMDGGLITGQDMQGCPVGGHLEHALNLNISNTVAAGQAHPRYVRPAAAGDGTTQTNVGVPVGARIQLDPAVNVDAWPSVTKEWQRQLLRTLQVYGGIVTDTAGAQGAGDGMMAQFPQQVAPYVFPWVADGSGWSYGSSFPVDILPHFRVIDWAAALPGINT